MTNPLEDFFNAPGNSHAREAILMNRLSYDLKLAAAERGYYLNTYFDDVDHDGFDIIFDDQDYVKKVQVKSVIVTSGTNGWDIHKRILRPSIGLLDTLGFEPSVIGAGTEGGVILMNFSSDGNALKIRYYYTDVFILLAFETGVMRRKHASSKTAVETCLGGLERGSGSEKLRVPIAAFLEAKGPHELLAMIGLHSNAAFDWKHHLILWASHTRPLATPRVLPAPLNILHEVAFKGIQSLCIDTDLIIGELQAGPTACTPEKLP